MLNDGSWVRISSLIRTLSSGGHVPDDILSVPRLFADAVSPTSVPRPIQLQMFAEHAFRLRRQPSVREHAETTR